MRKAQIMPMVCLRGLTIIPGMVTHFDLTRERSKLSAERAMKGRKNLIFLLTQKDINCDNPEEEDLYTVGCIAKIRQINKLPGNVVRVMVEGLERASLEEMYQEAVETEDGEKYTLFSKVRPEEDQNIAVEIHEANESNEQSKNRDLAIDLLGEAELRELKDLYALYANFFPRVAKSQLGRINEIDNLKKLIDEIISNIPVHFSRKQQILQALDIGERYIIISQILNREIEIAKVRDELAKQMQSRVDKNQKEFILREQLRYIREQLGEGNTQDDAEEYLEKLSELQASEEVKNKIKKEISRLQNISTQSNENSMERSYIETLLELPWDKSSKDRNDITKAEKILERDHYGLDKVKERILEYLAVRMLNADGESPILCLVGPPGTGKTSIAKSVAESLNKKYVRISLGGVRDEAEIRGHRRTYVGSMPGRIIQGLRQAGVKNPLMLLDEIDKAGTDSRGDTASALLEVLDGEQNIAFRDHYVEIPVDLSQVLFIATANDASQIPKPLRDRMELIEISSYTSNEKYHIATKYLLPKQLEKHGLDKKEVKINQAAMKLIIDGYTREAGVRSLERSIGAVCRKVAKAKVDEAEAKDVKKKDKVDIKNKSDKSSNESADTSKGKNKTVNITPKNLENYLGKIKFRPDKKNDEDMVGIVRGLAWTSVGGDTLEIEVNIMPGKGELKLTGQMGDVMKESAATGISYIRSVADDYKIGKSAFSKQDIHIHIPEGAVPKDGPSAGITMATAVMSALTNRKVDANLAMTGEITLRGRVLPIGGLKEKLLAAKTAGITKVLVPIDNRRDVEEISEEITEGMKILYMSHMDEVLKEALL